ncbi:dolichol-phosphate mannosyltransferase [Bryocella elongata]|uniref:Dolichol-phosphate mannosyltransferase n=1 Tax=Bryocella elongata TaxID=863522 RepID=A0A1H5VRZ3_9BACT|nr:glycosyltransferase family 2 protein [Bryocella elongata]SEF90052.1 dolichol-phosphate mannosyltransferase [Bryocella elongata]
MKNDRPYISIVIPVFRAESILPVLCERLTASLRNLNVEYEIFLIDDRSPDNSWEVMRQMAALYPTITAIRLSRNFGQHYALTAGLDFVSGEWTVTMDCDLQDQPEEIAKLLAVAEQGNDVVLARRVDRKDRWSKRWASRFFYGVYYLLSGHRMDPAVGSFRMMRRSVVDGYRSMREASRLFNGMVQWLGFTTAYVDVEHAARYEGSSSYDLRGLFRLATNGIVAFSNRPLYFSVAVGLTMSVFSVGFGAYVLILYLVHHILAVPGWMSLVTLTTFIGGLILLNLGILGIYVGRIYDETKGRPLYVVDQIVANAPSATLTHHDLTQPGLRSGQSSLDTQKGDLGSGPPLV